MGGLSGAQGARERSVWNPIGEEGRKWNLACHVECGTSFPIR